MSIVEKRLVIAGDIRKAFGTELTPSIDAGATYTVPAGIYLASLNTNTSAEYTPDGTTWRTFIPAGHGGVIISDGAKVRLKNAGSTAETSYLLPLA